MFRFGRIACSLTFTPLDASKMPRSASISFIFFSPIPDYPQPKVTDKRLVAGNDRREENRIFLLKKGNKKALRVVLLRRTYIGKREIRDLRDLLPR